MVRDSLRIVQFQIVDEVVPIMHGVLTVDTVIHTIIGLGLDGIVYRYDKEEKHWNPITTRRVNPLQRQPKKQQITIHDEREEK
jgi:hypothetical protein